MSEPHRICISKSIKVHAVENISFATVGLLVKLYKFIFYSLKSARKESSGQSYKAPTIAIYVSRVVNVSNLLVCGGLWSVFHP